MACTDKVMVGKSGIGRGFGEDDCVLYLNVCALVFIGIISRK